MKAKKPCLNKKAKKQSQTPYVFWTFLIGFILGLATATFSIRYIYERLHTRLLTEEQCQEQQNKYLNDCCWARCFGEEQRENCEKFCKQGAYLDY